MEEAIRKAEALIEALPYLQRFRGRQFVVKFGGSAMENAHVMDDVLGDVVFLATVGIRPIVVHGGGNAISRAMEKSGLAPRFIGGHRVTDAATLDIVVRVLSEVNADIIRRIEKWNGRGIPGFLGGSAQETARSLLRAQKKMMTVTGEDGKPQQVDVGFVGKVASVDRDRVETLVGEGDILVVPPIGQDDTGQLYNVNADSAASAIARDLKAEKIVFLSNVHGIMARPGDATSFMSHADKAQVAQMVKTGVISGGMLPKVAACLEALEAGVKKAHIVDGRLDHSLLLEIFTDSGVGTEIVAG